MDCNWSGKRIAGQIASKKFLDVLVELYRNKNTPAEVGRMILRVLSPFAYEYKVRSFPSFLSSSQLILSLPFLSFPSQDDADLSPLTKAYNKLRPVSDPMNGTPLDPDDPLFSPPPLPPASQQRYRRERGEERWPSKEEQLVRMREKAERAEVIARLLRDAVQHSKLDELETDEICAVR